MEGQNPYETLGLESDASASDIRKAYQKLVKIHHPDKEGDAKIFQEIYAAYETLYDTEKRRQRRKKHRPLPPGWTTQKSRSTGRIYYCNHDTGQSTYDRDEVDSMIRGNHTRGNHTPGPGPEPEPEPETTAAEYATAVEKWEEENISSLFTSQRDHLYRDQIAEPFNEDDKQKTWIIHVDGVKTSELDDNGEIIGYIDYGVIIGYIARFNRKARGPNDYVIRIAYSSNRSINRKIRGETEEGKKIKSEKIFKTVKLWESGKIGKLGGKQGDWEILRSDLYGKLIEDEKYESTFKKYRDIYLIGGGRGAGKEITKGKLKKTRKKSKKKKSKRKRKSKKK